MKSKKSRVGAAIVRGVTRMRGRQIRTCRSMAGKDWDILTDQEKREFGKEFYNSGQYARVGLTVARRCHDSVAQSYRLAKP
jgi:hypothetical protein